MNLPNNLEILIDKLKEHNIVAYVVGGAVRDYKLGIVPHDYDLASSATPEEIHSIFDNTDIDVYDTGIKFGTVTIKINEDCYEITTFRKENNYDGRKPEKISFSKSLEEDLSRRDFTINAIAYNPDEGFIDPFNGLIAIKARMLKAVGNAEERFSEDYLRVLRAIRFANKYNLDIHADTLTAINRFLPFVANNVSAERIQQELLKLLETKLNLNLMYRLNPFIILDVNFEMIKGYNQNNPHHDKDLLMHTLSVVRELQNSGADINLLIAGLFHDIGKLKTKIEKNGISHYYEHEQVSASMTKDILTKLRFSKKDISEICDIIKYHELPQTTHKGFQKLLCETNNEIIEKVFKLRIADILAQSNYKIIEKFSMLLDKQKIYIETKMSESVFSIKDLAVNGHDLIALGIEGKRIGEILKSLLKKVINKELDNNKESLLSYIKGGC